MNAGPLAVAVWLLLLWHGGLHAWQQATAALLLFALVWRERGRVPAWRDLGPTERVLALLLAAAACGLAVSLRPQATLNAVAGLGLAFTAALLIRRRAALPASRVAGLLMFGGAAGAAAFVGAGFLAWRFGGDPSPVTVARWFFPNQNLLAAGLALPALLLGLAGLAASARRPVPSGLCAAFGALALVYAGSRGAYVALAAGLFWLLLRWKGSRTRLAAWGALAVLAIAALTLWAPFSRMAVRLKRQATPGLEDENYYRRKDFWAGAAAQSLRRPMLGYGMGAFGAAALSLDLPTALTSRDPIARYRLSLDHAHNEWLELAVETGWPAALALAVCALAWLLRRRRSPRRDPDGLGLEAVLVAAGALSLVDMNLRTPGLAWGLVLCFCALEAQAAGEPEAAGSAGAAKLALAVAALAVFCLGGALVGQRFERDHDVHRSDGTGALEALIAQPLDAGLAAAARAEGEPVWPWTAWAGRWDPSWWWDEAMRADRRGEAAAAESDARRAVALRPYFAPGWYWLGLKLIQDKETAEGAQDMAQALRLEPNFCRVLAWQADQDRAAGDVPGERSLAQRIVAIRALRTDSMDEYTGYIQSVDSVWLKRHAAKNP